MDGAGGSGDDPAGRAGKNCRAAWPEPRNSFASARPAWFSPAALFSLAAACVMPILRSICTVVATLACAGPAAAVELAPHAALYALSLLAARAGSGIESVSGQMHAEWVESCDGWAFSHQAVFELEGAGGSVRLTANVATWESRDGLEYRFSVRNVTDGGEPELIEGHATLAGKDKGGRAVFERPDPEVMELPPRTLFPVIHSIEVIAAAEAGERIVPRIVFDGLTRDGALEVNAVVGSPIAASAPATAVGRLLAGRKSWPVHMAYFPLGSRAAEPQHEIRLRMYDNGVGEDLVLYFGDFTLRARLAELVMLPKPTCGAN